MFGGANCNLTVNEEETRITHMECWPRIWSYMTHRAATTGPLKKVSMNC